MFIHFHMNIYHIKLVRYPMNIPRLYPLNVSIYIYTYIYICMYCIWIWICILYVHIYILHMYVYIYIILSPLWFFVAAISSHDPRDCEPINSGYTGTLSPEAPGIWR